MLDDADVERVLVVTAHPDDVDFGAGGTVAAWTARGIEVAYCVVTDGDAGGFDPEVPRDQIGPIRRREQQAAADELGVRDVTYLGYPDGYLEVSMALRRDIVRQIRRVRPQRMLIQTPERNWQRMFASHPDHLAAGEAAMRAVYPDARNRFWMPELYEDGFEDWVVPEVWIMGHPDVDVVVDVTDHVDRKMAALRAHVSQETDTAELEARIRDWMRDTAVAGGLAEGRLAEAFKVVPTA